MAPDAHDHSSDLPEQDRDELAGIASLLSAQRPVPTPGFRGQLRRQLIARPAMWRPRRLRAGIAGFAASGAALMLVAAVSVAGGGPLSS